MELDEIDLTDLERFATGFPHEVFTRLRRERPVWFHPPTAHTPGGEGFWVVSRYADVAAAGADAETFSSEGGGSRAGGGTLIEDLPRELAVGVLLNMTDDPRHRRVRRLVTPSLAGRRLSEIEAELRARTATILDEAAGRGRCDLLRDVAAELPLQAIAMLMGIPQEDRHRLLAWADATLDYEGRELGEQSDKSRQAAAEMFEYGTRLIAKKRANPRDDLLSAVATSLIPDANGEPRRLSDLECQMFFSLMIAAGSETTRNSIAIGALAFAHAPEQWTLLERHRDLLPGAVEEMLRWASSTPYNRRTATRATALGGQNIEPGDKVTLWWASANRDERVFADPFRFDVTRSPNAHLAFGHGAHFCLGAALSRMEMRLVLDGLLDRFASIEIDGPVEWTRSNKHTGIRRMPVVLVARR
jgi:cytochrome P450